MMFWNTVVINKNECICDGKPINVQPWRPLLLQGKLPPSTAFFTAIAQFVSLVSSVFTYLIRTQTHLPPYP